MTMVILSFNDKNNVFHIWNSEMCFIVNSSKI